VPFFATVGRGHRSWRRPTIVTHHAEIAGSGSLGLPQKSRRRWRLSVSSGERNLENSDSQGAYDHYKVEYMNHTIAAAKVLSIATQLSTLPAGIIVPAFPQRSPPRYLTVAACGGLRSAPDCRTQRALLHLSYSCAPPVLMAALVSHDPIRTSGRLSPPY